jgi:hypothetical protein
MPSIRGVFQDLVLPFVDSITSDMIKLWLHLRRPCGRDLVGENNDLSPSSGFHKLDGPSGFAFSIFPLSIDFTDHPDRWVRYPFEPGYLHSANAFVSWRLIGYCFDLLRQKQRWKFHTSVWLGCFLSEVAMEVLLSCV